MLTIGLTGGIGSGKSTAADYFAELGAAIIDADVIARELVQPDSPLNAVILEHFGSAVKTANNELDRGKLREIIFNNPAERAWLEALLHPNIYAKIKQRVQQTLAPYCIAVIPLLLETNQQDIVQRVLLVDTTQALQHQRVQMRDQSDNMQIEQILQAQASRSQRLAIADDIIENTGSLAALREQVEKLHQYYLTLVKQAN